jgi:trehalose 6-phosphate phosphatase
MPDPFAALLAEPAKAAIVVDFDGTLAPIVDDPAAAAPLPGAVEALYTLTERFAFVGVVSGRPVAFLRARLGNGLWLSGLYGLESFVDGALVELPGVAPWRAAVADAVARARDEFGDAVEAKGLSLTLHFRTRPERRLAMQAWAAEEGVRSGLVVRPAKASLEVHPPLPVDKGTVVERAAAGLRAVCFLGDDVGDLPAFDALDRLASSGVDVVRVAIATDETPPELLERADAVVEGPEGALALLQRLGERRQRSR